MTTKTDEDWQRQLLAELLTEPCRNTMRTHTWREFKLAGGNGDWGTAVHSPLRDSGFIGGPDKELWEVTEAGKKFLMGGE